MTTYYDDMGSLVKHLQDKSLEAHNTQCNKCNYYSQCQVVDRDYNMFCPRNVEERTYNGIVKWIQDQKVNQRPHLTEEIIGR